MGSGSTGRLRFVRPALVLLALAPGIVWAARTLADVQARRWIDRGQAELAAGRYAGGLAHARLALRLQPSNASAALLAGRCLTRLGRRDEALPYLRLAGPTALEDQRARASELLQQGRITLAISSLQEVLRLDPADAEALRVLAGIHQARGEYDVAKELARRLAGDPAHEVVGQALLGTIHHGLAAQKLDSPGAAIRAFERVLELDPDLVRCPIRPRWLFWDFLARDLIAEGRPADARGYLEKALGSGENAGLVELLGQTYWVEGRLDEAGRCWERAMLLDPARADPWIGLGQLALRQDRAADAVRYLTRGLELSPDSVNPLYKLIQANRRLGRHAEASRLQEKLDALRAPVPADETPGPGR